MFKIGEFSKLGQVSTRMLRHYDKLGLLVPSQVDPWTGYRYYAIDQLAQLHRIIALKELGLTLQQVAELLADGNELPVEQLRGMLILKQAELTQEIQANQNRLANVAARLQQLEQHGQPAPYEVVVKSVSAQTIASIRQVVPTIEEMGYYCETLYQQLYQGLEQHGIKPLQPEIALYHNQEFSEVDIEIEMAVPISPKYRTQAPLDEKIIFSELPAHDTMAALIYEGPFRGVGGAMLSLLSWIGLHHYAPESPLRELRLSGPAHGDGVLQTEPVLELQIPIRLAEEYAEH